jgi:hypothetical protein
MDFPRIALLAASAGLVITACSGSDLTGGLGGDSPPASGTDAASAATASDSGPPSIDDSGAVNTPPPDRSEPADATGDATVSDSPSPEEPPPDDANDTGDSAPTESGPGGDAATDAAGTFACGPTKRCNAATEYCSVLGVSVVNDIVFPLDADRSAFSYSCDSLPACDASDACSCFENTGPVLRPNIIISGSCSCSDDGGDITRTCAN